MRAPWLALTFVLASGCTTDHCKQGTVFISYSLSGGAEAADTIDVTLAISGGAAQTKSVMRKSRDTSIEVDFHSYPSGQSLAFTLVARLGGIVLASASQTMTASPGCTALSFKLDGSQTDLGGLDLSSLDSSADLSTADLSGLDLSSDDAAPDLGPPIVPSCIGLSPTCGPSGTSSCCDSAPVPGGTYYRSYDVAGDSYSGNTMYPATVSDFRLDTYEVTVARFRAFVNAGQGTQASPPPLGAGARTLNGTANQGGWDSNWNSSLAVDTATLISNVKCTGLSVDSMYATFTDSPGANESRAMNCIVWFEAMAFCIWDGGFLPTEAEWNYAAAGGADQRAYSWSVPSGVLTLNSTYASYYDGTNCVGDGLAGCAVTDVIFPGSKPNGNGKWGHSDLGGNVAEWTLDWFVTPYSSSSCNDCSYLTPTSSRVLRGGWFGDNDFSLRSGSRGGWPPNTRNSGYGIRCARGK